jgi:hypothetical protein
LRKAPISQGVCDASLSASGELAGANAGALGFQSVWIAAPGTI